MRHLNYYLRCSTSYSSNSYSSCSGSGWGDVFGIIQNLAKYGFHAILVNRHYPSVISSHVVLDFGTITPLCFYTSKWYVRLKPWLWYHFDGSWKLWYQLMHGWVASGSGWINLQISNNTQSWIFDQKKKKRNTHKAGFRIWEVWTSTFLNNKTWT